MKNIKKAAKPKSEFSLDRKHDQIILFIPENLSFNSKNKDKYYYILNRIYHETYLNNKNNDQTFIPLNSHLLHETLGGDYIKYIRKLIAENIIESDQKYIIGEKSKGYRFTDKYRNQKPRGVVLSDKYVIKSIIRNKNRYDEEIKSNSTFGYLYSCLEKLEIDYSGALEYIYQNISEADKEVSYTLSVEELNKQNLFCIIDSTAGRLHSNVTNFPSQLRKYLSVDNKDLVEVDIANSQPLLFNILISHYLSSNPDLFYLSPIYSINISPYGTSKNTDISYFKNDITLYKELTEEGKFYEYLMDKMLVDIDRSIFKKLVFGKIFYCKENPNYVYSEKKVFLKLFPTVSNIITYYKRDDYRNLAIKLQQVEAEFILHTIAPKLKERGIYALTIHDSILTTVEDAVRVKLLIENEFINKFNLNPTIRIK